MAFVTSAERARTVASACDGDSEALRLLVARASTLALRTAWAVLSSEDQARDISQDVAVDVLRGLNSLKEPEAFDAWVHRITSRHLGKALRRRMLRRRAETPLALMNEPAGAAPPDDRIMLQAALAGAMRDLPTRQRLAIALRYVHDLSDADIARALECREGTVHALLSRARATLRSSPQLSELNPVLEGGKR